MNLSFLKRQKYRSAIWCAFSYTFRRSKKKVYVILLLRRCIEKFAASYRNNFNILLKLLQLYSLIL